MNKSKLYLSALALAMTVCSWAQPTPRSQMERLGRGAIAVSTSATANFVSWRLLGTDDKDITTFDLLRDGEVIATDLKKTNYTDKKGSRTSQYQVVTKVNGQATETTQHVTPWTSGSLAITLDRPATGANGGSYTPNDCSVGDVDGDGEYEIILKWDPSNAKDNSQSGKTDNVILDCYKIHFDGTGEVVNGTSSNSQLLWRIDLGPNIRAGAHYTQFMVYDFNGDGLAEMMCKTAPGSKDGTGTYVNQAATDATIKSHDNTKKYANSDGYILSGPEYLTVFDGKTGKAIHTTWYLPGRTGTGGANSETGVDLGKVLAYPSDKSFWGDNYGNRSERYLAGVAYINGADKPACGVFCRGYYTRAYVWAVSYDGTRLHSEWLHVSPTNTGSLVYTKDIDNTQSWKVITIDDDQLQRTPLKTAPANTRGAGSKTLYGNGNHNLSIADVDGDGCDEIIWGSAALNNDGFLLYATGYGHGDAIHLSDLLPDRPGLEVFQVHEDKTVGYGWDLHDAATGEIIYSATGDSDNGRGLAADISGSYRGFEFWSSNDRTPRQAADGKATSLKNQSVNFRVYWNGDAYDDLLDGHYAKVNDAFDHVDHIYITTGDANRIVDWTNRSNCNTTKMTPNLSADILGDWREEIILWDYKKPTELYIHTTTTETTYAVPTLMHDHTYRMGVCWQNTAYNQPPHLGYFLPDYVAGKLVNAIPLVSSVETESQQAGQVFDLQGRRLGNLKRGLNIVREGGKVKKIIVK